LTRIEHAKSLWALILNAARAEALENRGKGFSQLEFWNIPKFSRFKRNRAGLFRLLPTAKRAKAEASVSRFINVTLGEDLSVKTKAKLTFQQ
jgi:hypothetical protein